MDRTTAAQELKRLAKELAHHDHLYYNLAQPILTDHEYDQLRKENSRLEALYPDLVRPDSASHRVGATPLQNFNKVIHRNPMLSLDNVFTEEDLTAFFEKIRRFLNFSDQKEIAIWAEPKIDGLSASLIYENGILKQGATRGDGTTGEDVTQNIKTIQNIPLVISDFDTLTPPNILEIRGEVYMTKSAFKKLNDERSQRQEPLFANPRNAAAGSLRQLDSNVTRKRCLRFFAYEVLTEAFTFETQQSLSEFLKRCGFQIASPMQLCKNENEILAFYEALGSKRHELSYEIDGVVYKINDRQLQTRLGTIGRTPRHSIAHKFPAEQVETVLRNIIIQVGRMGTLTPVAVFDSVTIGGVIVNRATLHNAEEIARKDIRIGDTVVLQRAGDVIPQIVRVIIEKRPAKTSTFSFPSLCPSCGTTTLKEERCVAIKCPAGFACQAQAIERFSHFVSRDAFDIEGLGDQNIRFLYETHRIKDFVDLFTLQTRNEARRQNLRERRHEEEIDRSLEHEEGWGPLSVKKLFKAIEERRIITLPRFIYALGIPQIGQRTSTLLAQHFKKFDAFWSCTEAELINVEGIGKKMAQDILDFTHDAMQEEMVKTLQEYVTVTPHNEQDREGGPFTGKTIVFTGSLQKFSRNEAKALAERLGAKIGSSVSKSTHIVVAGSDSGKKKEEAERLGIQVWNEDEWLKQTR